MTNIGINVAGVSCHRRILVQHVPGMPTRAKFGVK